MKMLGVSHFASKQSFFSGLNALRNERRPAHQILGEVEPARIEVVEVF